MMPEGVFNLFFHMANLCQDSNALQLAYHMTQIGMIKATWNSQSNGAGDIVYKFVVPA